MKIKKNLSKFTFSSALLLSSLTAQSKPLSSASPASMYKTKSMLFDFSLLPSWSTYVDGDKTSKKNSKDLSLTGLYHFDETDFTIGLNSYLEKTKNSKAMTITAGVGYTVSDQWSLGVDIAPRFESSGQKSTATSLGAIYHEKSLELGFAYEQTIKHSKKAFGTHVKQKLSDDLSTQIEYKMAFPDSSSSRSIFNVKAKIDYKVMPELGFKAGLAYVQNDYVNISEISASKIPRISYELETTYSVTDHFSVSGGFEFTRGIEKQKDTDYIRKGFASSLSLIWRQ